MWHIPKIVLTGGPCSGKSSAQSILAQRLPTMGYCPIFMPETATTLLGCGIDFTPVFADPKMAYTFQQLVLRHQLHTENIFTQLAEFQLQTGINPVIFHDRGSLDSIAYIGRDIFSKIVAGEGLSFGQLHARYDGILHLVTAADGAEAFYNFDNPARYETPEQARQVDKALQHAWSGHPNLKIVENLDGFGNALSFGEKMDMMVSAVCHILGVPAPIETERKFLLAANPELNRIPVPVVAIEIVQTYLQSQDPLVERRVRQWSYSGDDRLYFYTEKRQLGDDGRSRFESERQISASEYLSHLNDRDPHRQEICKTRFCFAWHNQYFELDEVEQPFPLFVLEVQATEQQQHIVLPDFLAVLKEVTGDDRYKMASVAAGLCPGYSE